MKTYPWLLIVFIFTIFSSMDVRASDLEKDQQIISVIASDEFVNVLMYYPFEGHEYPIRIIHNPKKEMLWGNHLSSPSSLSLMMFADVPISLARHLEDLILEQRGSSKHCYFSLKYETPETDWDLIWPVYIAESVIDPINDEIIQSIFSSTIFVNQVIYYHLDNQYYQVRILHNPEEKKFTATREFQLEAHRPLSRYSLSWNKRYAILVDKHSPQELTNHLSAPLNHLSYWNWYFNFTLENGTYVQAIEQFGNTTYYYSLDTWFNYTDSFGQDVNGSVK